MEFDLINGRVVQRPAQPNIEFFIHPALDIDASNKEGRRVHKDTVYIKIRAQGAKDFISRKATEDDFGQYPHQYASFKNQKPVDGTDVALLINHTADLADIKALGIHTIEQLSEIDVLPENLAQYQVKAKAFIQIMGTNDESNTIQGQEAANH